MAESIRLYKGERERVEMLELAAGNVAVYCRGAPGHGDGNEDAAAVIVEEEERLVLVVADGMGGAAQGAEAARLALQTVARTVTERDGALRHSLLDGIEAANHAVLAMGTGAACTLTAVQITNGTARSFQVGDSSALVVGQRGKVKHQSISQGPAGYAVASGLVGEEEAMHLGARHIVSNAVGSSEMHIDVGPQLPLARRDTVLLATDGLLDNLYHKEIVEQIRKGPLGEVAERLVQLCRQRMLDPAPEDPSKLDDMTFILFRRG